MPMQLEQAQEQRLTLTQSLRTSISVLQMNCFELAGFLQERSMENPLLEYEGGGALLRAEQSAAQRTRSAARDGGSFDPLLNARGRERDVRRELCAQLDFLPMDEDVRRTAHYIIYNLDTRGYLPISTEDVERDLHCGAQCVRSALAAVQELDPAGIGARDLRECLALQLARMDGDFPVEHAILERDLLTALAQKRYAELAAALNVPRAAAEHACAVIRSLEPIPLNGEESDDPLRLAVPEVEVVWTGARYEAALIDGLLPSLRLSSEWEGGALDPEAQRYVTQKSVQARELITWVERRKETLLRCAKEIAAAQQEYFERGAAYLRPMHMKDLAEKLSCHVSTVSRALSGKYLECRWGVLELSWFFQRAADGATGADMSAAAVQARIQELIAAEDKRQPLSDQALANALASGGVQVARRTVAKYREALGLPPAQARRAAE